MPLVIPATSSYGDSTTTEGSPLRKYVLAQVRQDAHLDWVHELRSVLGTTELKYREFKKARPRIRRNQQLWSRVEKGVGQASVIIVDPNPLHSQVVLDLLHDLAEGDRNSLEPQDVIDRCASAIVAETPIAYLPYSLAMAVPWSFYEPIGNLEEFTPKGIRDQLGPGLEQAQIFAARAHAAFDLTVGDNCADSTHDIFRSPLARLLLKELLATSRVFDTESPRTLPILNRAADEIAESLQGAFPFRITERTDALIREADSRAIDEIQAADMAAGWARETLETSDARVLATRFERVWLNGHRVR